MGISIEEYFSNPDNVIEAQLKMQKKYSTDCLYAFFYASIETDAFGGSTKFFEDGPPNAMAPTIRNTKEIASLVAPKVADSKGLQKVLKAIEGMKQEVGNTIPIIGVAVSPFSLPIMQLGFDKYLDLIYGNKHLFDKLMEVNQSFCVEWANAQVSAGATAICYFDPISSTTNIPPKLYRQTGFEIAKQTIAQIKAPVATHFASGRCLPIVEDVAQTGTAIICTSSLEDIGEVKKACKGKMSVLGNLNGIEMCRWTEEEAENEVKKLILLTNNEGVIVPSLVSSRIIGEDQVE